MSNPDRRTLILVRHAHRDKDEGRQIDNGLSEKGQLQARRIAKYFLRRHAEVIPPIYSSPKLRCIETVQPLANELRVEIEVLPLLSEQATGPTFEGGRAFLTRIRAFHELWTKGPHPISIACSHGDWIPQYLKRVVGARITLKKGAWAELDFDGENVRLRWLLQEL